MTERLHHCSARAAICLERLGVALLQRAPGLPGSELVTSGLEGLPVDQRREELVSLSLSLLHQHDRAVATLLHDRFNPTTPNGYDIGHLRGAGLLLFPDLLEAIAVEVRTQFDAHLIRVVSADVGFERADLEGVLAALASSHQIRDQVHPCVLWTE